jgi:hypothetical protein
MKLEIDWLKKNHQMIHYFGLGFIQLKIDKHNRLHFYTPELPPIIDEEDIHNHRYDFTSSILRGKMEQQLFVEIPGATHIKEDESCQADVKPETSPSNCSVLMTSSHTYAEGSSYFIDHDTFHRVKTNNCITHLNRGGYKKKYAQVIRPMESGKICPFSQKIEEGRLWEIIETMIR